MALTWQVLAQVLPEVDELQGRANGIALRQGPGGVHAIKVQQQAADGVGRVAAIVQQLGRVGVGGLRGCHAHVLLKGTKQVGQKWLGQLVGLHLNGQRAEDLRPGGTRQHGGLISSVELVQIFRILLQQ